MPTRDWAAIRKTLIANYNPKVQAEFGATPSASDQLLMNEILIKSNDSSLIAQSRMALFNQQYPQSVAIASLPERYQLSLEGNLPQLVCLFRELKEDGSLGKDWYPITIPHPLNTIKDKQTALPNYKKGSWELILTLKDNSKVFVNAFSQNDAEEILKSINPQIDSNYLTNSFQKIGQRKGQALKEIVVKMVRADYYPTGAENSTPAWNKHFI